MPHTPDPIPHGASSSQAHQEPQEAELSNAVGIGAATLCSRLLALARDMLLAWTLGTTAAGAVFWAAFRLVTALRRLFGDGAISLGLTPLLRGMQAATSGRAGQTNAAFGAARAAALWAALLLTLPALICWLFPQAALALFAPGLVGQADGRVFAICLLYAPFACALAVFSALLHAGGRFRHPALAPVIFNLLLLAAAGWAYQLAPQSALYVCAWAVPIAGLVQLLYILPPMLRLAGKPGGTNPNASALSAANNPTATEKSHARAAMLFPHMGRGMLTLAAPQVAGLFCLALASGLGEGTAAMYFSERLTDLPLGLVGISLGTALLPGLSALHARGDSCAFSFTLVRACRMGLFLGIPAAVGLTAVAPALVATLLGHGNFQESGVLASGNALMGHVWAIPALILVRCLAAACFAQAGVRAAKAPARAACLGAVLTVLLALLLLRPLGLFGLGLAVSLGGWANALLLLRPAGAKTKELARPALLGTGCSLVACSPAAWFCHASGLSAPLALGLGISSGLVLYFALSAALRRPEWQQLRHTLRPKDKTAK